MSDAHDAGDESSEHSCNASSEPRKRPGSSPTYLTPHRREKRVPLRELVANNGSGVAATPRSLSQAFQCLDKTIGTSVVQPSKDEKWSDTEKKALVEFLLFHCTGECWPAHKNMEFWSSASDFVRTRSGCTTRSGMAFNMFECYVRCIPFLDSKC